MIDGVQFTYHADNTALTALPIWEVLVHEQTGTRVNDVRTASVRAMHLQLKPRACNEGLNLIANGSLHKWYNCGEHNTNDFPFTAVHDTINSITEALTVKPLACELHGIEVGINITLPFSPLRIIKNVVCYKGKPFTQINKRNAHKGIVCSLSEYDVKLYDKAAQSGVDCGNVLRFEVHVHKMRLINDYNITTLAHLQDCRKVYVLKQFLIDVLAGIVWTDTNVKLSALNNREQKQWLALSNATYWAAMDRRKAYRERKRVTELISKYGMVTDLKPFVNDTWERLFESVIEAEKVGHFHSPLLVNEAEKNGTISQLECNGKMSHALEQETRIVNTTILLPLSNDQIEDQTESQTPIQTEVQTEKKVCVQTDVQTLVQTKERTERRTKVQTRKPLIQREGQRTCKMCGRDRSSQQANVVFCSERRYGRMARACRNKDSIRRYKKKATKDSESIKS